MDTRIYAQMRPDHEGIAALGQVQEQLTPQNDGRLIGSDELHLTLIHFGKANDVFASVAEQTKDCREAFDEALARYVVRTTALLPDQPIELSHTGYELLGTNKTTLAATFERTEALNALHTKLFGVLVEFFEQLDVPQPLEFITNDPNFMHAMTLHPHVTLYKGYRGELPTDQLGTLRFESMDVRY